MKAAKAKQKYTALITGASGGIGEELARLFARDGHDLVLVARSGEKLEQMALQFAVKYKVYTKVIPQDLAKPQAAQQIFDALQKDGITVDVLVNNAGFGNYGYFKSSDLQKELDMMQVNMVALTHMSKLFLKQLPDNRMAKILNIASVAAFPPGPLMAVYYASKAYVLSFSEALAEELKEDHVTVTVLCPGATATGFKQHANLEGSGIFRDEMLADAKSVAKAGYKAMLQGEVVVFPDLKSRLMPYIVNLVPRPLLRKVVKSFQEKRK